MLESLGFQPDYLPDIKQEEIYQQLKNYEVLFVRSKIAIDERLLDAAPNLKVVGRAGAGIDQVNVEALKRRGIVLINAPEGNRDAVAEHAVGMLLSLFNKLLQADKQVRQRIWDREGNRGLELSEKTVGIIGYGFMGQALAKRLQGFGCRVIAYDKYRSGFSDEKVKECSLEELCQETDILSLHVPLTPETRGMVDTAFLQRFRKDIFMINTARGEIIPMPDLEMALKNGKIRGAALDVMENEKLHDFLPEQEKVFQYLVQCDNVVFTPHVAGWTQESYVKINEVLVEKLKILST